jgi:hypothetical protein
LPIHPPSRQLSVVSRHDSTSAMHPGSTPPPPHPGSTPVLLHIRARLHRRRVRARLQCHRPSELNSTAAASGLDSNTTTRPSSTPPPLRPGSTPPSPRWPHSHGRGRRWWCRCTSHPSLGSTKVAAVRSDDGWLRSGHWA